MESRALARVSRDSEPIYPLLSEEGCLRAFFARRRGGVPQVGYTTRPLH